MDCRQNKKPSYFSLILALIVCTVLAATSSAPAARVLNWHSMTSFDMVTDITMYNGFIWIATSGGLVRIDPDTEQFLTFTNVDGLQTNDLKCLFVDARNRLWVGGDGRLINYSNPDNPDGYLFTDRDDIPVEIYDIAGTPDGDSLWLANRLGVSLFLAGDENGDGIILDTYTRLGDISRNTTVRRLALDSDSIWAATVEGLAVGSREDPRLLKAQTGWTSYIPSDLSGEIVSDELNGLIIKNDSVIVGTPHGMYLFEYDQVPVLINLGLFANPLVYNVTSQGDSVFAHTARGTTLYYNGLATELTLSGMPIPNTTSGLVGPNGRLWLGNLLYGIYYREGTVISEFDVGGMPSNDCRAFARTQGYLWGAFWDRGLAKLDGNRWVDIPEIEGLVGELQAGPRGELWVGTFGGGGYRVDGDSIAHFDTTNSALSGLLDAPGTVVITDIIVDGGAVWFANFLAVDGEVVVVDPFDLTRWQAYNLVSGAQIESIEALAAGQGVVYAGSADNGIYAVAYSGTPYYLNDDFRWTFTESNSGIGSNNIRSLMVDGYDSLWVGTAFGLSYQALGEVIFTNVPVPDGFGPEVTAIDFDGQGSVFAGSDRGLAIRDIATADVEHYTTLNSGLVNDAINDIFYDAEANTFWIATAGGASKITMPNMVTGDELENVLAYPNPFVIEFGDETVRFNYAGLAEVRIFTIAGELVRELPVTGIWDGRNDAGRMVATGTYFFTVTSQEGEVGRGKLYLIRK